MNDARTQRERSAAADANLDRSLVPPGDCSAACLGTTTTVETYPTAAGAYYAFFVTDCGGPETEGAAVTYVPGTAVFYALNAGSQVPPSGTRVLVHAVGGRWVFRYDG